MANKYGAHQRPAGQQGANKQGTNRNPANAQGGQQRQGANRDPRAQQYQQYGSQQGAYQRAASNKAAYAKSSAQSPLPSNPQDKQIYTFDDDYFAQYDLDSWGSGKQKKRRKGHALRNTLIVILVVVLVIGGFGAFTGFTLYESAKQVRSDASAVMQDITTLTDKVMSDDPSQATTIANNISDRAKNMKAQTEGWQWTLASYVPVYGSDVVKVRELSNVLDDLSTNAIVPLVDEVSQVSMSNLFSNGSINVANAQKLISAIDAAAPVIERSANTIDAMGAAQLEQINRPLAKARTAIDGLNTVAQFVSGIAPTFSQMLGADGNPRTYLVVAQSNSEIRSTGGFLGSVGPLHIDNGNISLGDFRGIADIYPQGIGEYETFAPMTDEELSIFGPHVSYQIADCNFIPDFSRVGEIVKYAWEAKGYEHVDGVIGVDPVFLQDMLSIAGPVTTSTGVTVDGSNAATYLLHDVYYLPSNDEQDAVFEEVAAQSFNQLMSNLGNVSITQLADIVNKNIDARRFMAYMVAENEESAMELIGCDGKLSHDAENPVLGAYFNDESWSKMFWYIKVESTVGAGAKNADGSITYPVTVTYRNMIEPGHEEELANYMKAHNILARSVGDMITMVVLTAPEGGKITDVEAPGTYIPAGTDYRAGGVLPTGTMTEATLQGLDTWWGEPMVLPGESFTISCKVTTSPKATTPLTVVRTATAQEVAGW